MPRRSGLVIASLLMLAAAAVVVGPQSGAAAGVLDLTCTSVQTTTYSPGVTLSPKQQDVTVSTVAAPCTSLTEPDIKSGKASFSLQGERSCLDLDQAGSGTASITWNTGATSVFTYSSQTETVAGQVIVTSQGIVDSGPFKDAAVVQVLASPTLGLLDCLFDPGITERTGTGVIQIISV